MQKSPSPPRLADRLLAWFCKPELLEGIQGDLQEYWERSKGSSFRKSLTYWIQVIALMRPFALKRFQFLHHNTISMVRFNLLLSWRNMRNNRLYTLLNISGLSLAIISCIFIVLYVLDEQSFDQHWEDVEQIHRITHYNEQNGDAKINDHIRTQVIIADYLKTEFPDVKKVGRISTYQRRKISKGNKWIEQDKIGITEQDFLNLFSFKPLYGNLDHALDDINTIVLTESIAKKYFGEVDVIGRSLLMNDSSQYKVTGVIEDIPKTAHFQYEAFLNNGAIKRAKRTWAYVGCITYVKIDPEYRPKLESEIYNMIVDYGAKDWEEAYGITDVVEYLEEQGYVWRVDLIPIAGIHLNSPNKELEVSGKGTYLTILKFLGAFLAFIAIFNFINLSTAKASSRVKEIAIKRVLGSQKKQLLIQFLTESFLYSFLATLVAVLIVYLLIDEFNALANKSFTDPLFNHFDLWKYVVPSSIFMGFVAGIYPAYYLSRLKTLNTKTVIQSGIKSQVRSACVILQFTISAVLIFGSIAVLFQLNYLDSKDLGFEHRSSIVFYVDHLRLGKSDQESNQKRSLFTSELRKSSYFSNVSSSSLVPMGNEGGNTGFTFFSTKGDKNEQLIFRHSSADHNLIPTLGLELVKGRNFRLDEVAEMNSAILTESAAKMLNLTDPVGSSIIENFDNSEYKIVGVIKDFNYVPLHREIAPLIIKYNAINYQTIAKFQQGKSVEAFQEAERIWSEIFPNYPLSADFMEVLHEKHYREEKRMSSILILGSGLAIFIACLGLFGLSTYSTERRKKEIGVRKVLGATREVITGMLVADFARPILISLVIGLPIAYYLSQLWLENFAYRITVGWEIGLASGLLTIILGLLTVGFLSFKSASEDPTENLRYE